MKDTKRLSKYLAHIKDRLNSDTPPKHKDREKSYRQYLERELESTSAKLEALKLEGK